MHIEKIKLNKFRVLKDMEIKFLVPPSCANEHENTVNVVAGINGTGKTSLLEAIYQCISEPVKFIREEQLGDIFMPSYPNPETNKDRYDALGDHVSQLSEEMGPDPLAAFHDTGSYCLIFLTSKLSFNYKTTSLVIKDYQRVRKINNSDILGDAEFYIKDFVLSQERKSRVADPEERTKEAIRLFNEKFQDTELLTKLEGLDPKQFNRPIFSNAADEKVTIDQLSDGEKQLYGRVISLMILDPNNSVILIDEPEIALHPSWQQQIMSVYSKIGKNNQFIVATHSPQIIASTNYENLIILTKQDGKISALYPNSPPSGVDVNSILEEVMGVKNTLPKDVDDLQREYRQLVKSKKEDSPEAAAIKEKLLERESNDSKFMQEMRLLIRLRGAK